VKRRAWLLAGFLGLAAPGCSPKQNQKQDPTVIATVNGEVIPRRDFERQLAREAQAMEGDARTPEQMAPYKAALLETLTEHLLLLQAAKAAGVQVTQEEVDRRVLALSSEYPAGTFDEALSGSQTTRAALIRSTREQLTIEKLLQQQVFGRVAVTEEQIRRSFDEHAEEFAEPEQVHAQQIVVRGLDEAKRIQQQLWQGKKFSELARRYSLSADAKVGGDLGFFARGQMPPAFDDVVFHLAPGSTSEVVSTDYGFHLFRVLERRPAHKRDLAEVRPAIEQKLVSQLRAEAQRRYVEGLKGRAEVKVNADTLQAATGRVVGAPSAEP
jgi:peptidyl-prolyl cis-trans isomerase C/foldase protein PrsA